jgi:serine/threonine protein kinase
MAKASLSPKLAEMQYRVIEQLGTGAGSTILLIGDKKTGKRYALKVVKRQSEDDDIYVEQAQLEYEVLQKLRHPAIVRAYDCRVKRNWLFKVAGIDLLLEYVEGRTIDEVEMLELGQLVLIFLQVADGLIHMHRRGVYHGDLKPTNIMLTKDGRVKIIDFGTAWLRNKEKNRVQGTPQYMAPEQATEKVVNEKTDIYNFGATMYRMFTGRYANMGIPKIGDGGLGDIGAGGPMSATRGKLKPPIAINPNIPGPLNELILNCLEISPDRRPAGMFEVKTQLEAIARHMGLEAMELRGSELDDEE